MFLLYFRDKLRIILKRCEKKWVIPFILELRTRRCGAKHTSKSKRYWKCSHCGEWKLQVERTAWQETRACTQDSTQACNTCISLGLVCHVARRANQRLTPLGERDRRQRQQSSLEEVRKETQKIAAEKTTTAATLAKEQQQADAETDKVKTMHRYWYTCPFCVQVIESIVHDGQEPSISVWETVSRARCHKHTCPTCGTIVHSIPWSPLAGSMPSIWMVQDGHVVKNVGTWMLPKVKRC